MLGVRVLESRLSHKGRDSHVTKHAVSTQWRVQFDLLLLQMFVLWGSYEIPQNKHLKQ